MNNTSIKNIVLQLKDGSISKQEARKRILELKQNDISYRSNNLTLLNAELSEDLCYRVILSGKEDFFCDHIINNKKIFPASAYFELAATACKSFYKTNDTHELTFRNTVWINPLIANQDEIEVNVQFTKKDTYYEFIICSYKENSDTAIEHASGSVALSLKTTTNTFDITTELRQCDYRIIEKDECYTLFDKLGISYGPSHQAIENISIGNDNNGYKQAISKLHLKQKHLNPSYTLHPGLLDTALQTTITYSPILDGIQREPTLPFSIESLVVHGQIPPTSWVWVRFSIGATPNDPIRKLDIDIIDENGIPCVSIRGYSARKTVSSISTLIFSIKEKNISANIEQSHHHLANEINLPMQVIPILVGEIETFASELKLEYPRTRTLKYLSKESASESIEERGTHFETLTWDLIKLLNRITEEPLKTPLAIHLIVKHEHPYLSIGLHAALKSAHREFPNIYSSLVQVKGTIPPDALVDYLQKIRRIDANGTYLIHNENGRSNQQKQVWIEIPKNYEINTFSPWKNQGVYLITGGNGGIAGILAEDIVEKSIGAHIYLIGRSAQSIDLQTKIESWNNSGHTVQYIQSDVSNSLNCESIRTAITSKHTSLNALLHCAGITDDGLLNSKTQKSVSQVLAPKVNGTLNLFKAFSDFLQGPMVLFSSGSSAFGNAGQTDYAAANGFLDGFSKYVKNRQKNGRTNIDCISINWPLWLDGGMEASPKLIQHMHKKGLHPLSNKAGLQALYVAIKSKETQVSVLHGDSKKIRDRIENINIGDTCTISSSTQPEILSKIDDSSSEKRSESPNNSINNTVESLQDSTEHFLRVALAKVTQLPISRIDNTTRFDKYGIDSLLVMQFTKSLENNFGPLPKTLLFEYQTIDELREYFFEEHKPSLEKMLQSQTQTKRPSDSTVNINTQLRNQKPDTSETPAPPHGKRSDTDPNSDEIAIIGLAGKYAKSDNIHEYWKNLAEGNDCIETIPSSRWDHAVLTSTGAAEEADTTPATYAKWGGFIEGVENFDPLFFNISPRDAERMDPQERMFLQCAHDTLEDSGYTAESLKKSIEKSESGDVGVFVGVMYEEYVLYGAQEQALGNQITLAGSPSSIANRVSYSFDLHGPSMAVDTMCSSSLSTIHLACQSIRNNECTVAFAGGVNLCIHPNKFLLLGQGKFAATDGKCKSFGDGGDGYVPGEGVGAVLLKPLALAERDGDHIYGVIKGSALNHGGTTNAYTVPNPRAQANVIRKAIKRANIPAATVNYIEAHGTGTALGDPIEISGLSNALKDSGISNCIIGSAKSNIGHCESAAGIAAVTKILLQFKHNQIAPSLHSSTLNPHIDFDQTPFTVQQNLTNWPHPSIDSIPHKRRAGASSFGAGGSNAHIILEEYVTKERDHTDSDRKVVVPISAASEKQLTEIARRLLHDIERAEMCNTDISRLAYTLQTGRRAHEYRIAWIVDSLTMLKQRLSDYIDGKSSSDNTIKGHSPEFKNPLENLHKNNELTYSLRESAKKGNYQQLAELWSNGLKFDWSSLYTNDHPIRISLPTYPFLNQRYWLPDTKSIINGDAINGSPLSLGSYIHPLLHRNTSDFQEQRYTSSYSALRPILTSNIEGALLEMARAAIQNACSLGKNKHITLSHIQWHNPVLLGNDNTDLNIALTLNDNNIVFFEIYSADDKYDEVSHCTGQSDIDDTRLQRTFTISNEYRENQTTKILEEIDFHATQIESLPGLVIPPNFISVITEALNTKIIIENKKESCHFAIESLSVYAAMTSRCWLLIDYTNSDFNKPGGIPLHIINEHGKECLFMSVIFENFLFPPKAIDSEQQKRVINE